MIAFRAMASATYASSATAGDAAWAIWATWTHKIDNGISIKRFMTDLPFAHLFVPRGCVSSLIAHGPPPMWDDPSSHAWPDRQKIGSDVGRRMQPGLRRRRITVGGRP